MKIVLALTGASGAVYGVRLAEALHDAKNELHIVVTKTAKKIIKHELGGERAVLRRLLRSGKLYDEDEMEAPFASGSFRADAVVICPCSTKTLAAIACGLSHNLVCRAADVAIKEKRKLVLVIRETPLSAIHLENALKLSRLGVVIMPASPAFYPSPREIGDVVDFVVGKVLDSLGVENKLYRRWKDAP
ncbi:MAG: UbiX family flavin prenyltransferase [Candidatus Micrarchaeota archaeon]